MLEKIKELIIPALNEHNVELYDIEYVKEGGNNFLRIYIDNSEGIDIDRVTDVSYAISALLDVVDPISDDYFLEVSSPGAERPLNSREHLMQAIDKHINVKLKEAVNGLNEIQGDLISFEEDTVTIAYKVKNINKKAVIAYDNILNARLAIKF